MTVKLDLRPACLSKVDKVNAEGPFTWHLPLIPTPITPASISISFTSLEGNARQALYLSHSCILVQVSPAFWKSRQATLLLQKAHISTCFHHLKEMQRGFSLIYIYYIYYIIYIIILKAKSKNNVHRFRGSTHPERQE